MTRLREEQALPQAHRILRAMARLVANGNFRMTPREISEESGIEYHAVQRLAKTLESNGNIRRGPEERDGMLVWRFVRAIV